MVRFQTGLFSGGALVRAATVTLDCGSATAEFAARSDEVVDWIYVRCMSKTTYYIVGCKIYKLVEFG